MSSGPGWTPGDPNVRTGRRVRSCQCARARLLRRPRPGQLHPGSVGSVLAHQPSSRSRRAQRKKTRKAWAPSGCIPEVTRPPSLSFSGRPRLRESMQGTRANARCRRASRDISGQWRQGDAAVSCGPGTMLSVRRGGFVVCGGQLWGPGAKVDRCLLSSSSSRACHCCPKVENSKPLNQHGKKPFDSDHIHGHTVGRPLRRVSAQSCGMRLSEEHSS